MRLPGFIARKLKPLAPPVPPATPPDGLRHCPVCRGEHVCPMEWEPSDELHWRIFARCGDCAHWCETVISNEQAARLDRELDRDMDAIRRAVARLDAERMALEVEAFAQALARDLIAAADFAR